jgi:hypothetical protein
MRKLSYLSVLVVSVTIRCGCWRGRTAPLRRTTLKPSRAAAVAVVASLVILTAACSDTSTGSQAGASGGPSTTPAGAAATGSGPYVGYPDSILVLGHSGATGESSDPAQPGVEVRENSWATGTNPAVQSLYLRLLSVHPQIKDHNVNLARGGATVDDLVGQAQEAVTQKPTNPLVVIQIMDSDIVCPATSNDYASFASTFASALRTLDAGLPSSRLFVVSQFGSPPTYAKALTPAQRVSAGGTGPCAFLDSGGQVVPKELARLEGIIHQYEARLQAGCLKVTRCRYDEDAFGDVVDRPEYIAPDLNHFSIKGHAEAATVAWAAMKKAQLVPTPG